jgi:hypothetical protein
MLVAVVVVPTKVEILHTVVLTVLAVMEAVVMVVHGKQVHTQQTELPILVVEAVVVHA